MRDFGAIEEEDDMRRFIVDSGNISGDVITIDNAHDVHHITDVLRLKPGAKIDVSDSHEWEYRCAVTSLTRDSVLVKILDKQRLAREPVLAVTLYQAIPKAGKMETIIQKSVELGVTAIVPMFTARTVVEDTGGFAKKTDRWRRVAAEAVKQCRRGIVPPVEDAIRFSEMLARFAAEGGMKDSDISGAEGGQYDLLLFPYEGEEERTIKQVLRGLSAVPQTVAIVIGPEGGFSDEEAAALSAAGAESVSLGRTVLRTETAGPTALAMVMYEFEL